MVLRCNVWSPVFGTLQADTDAARHVFELATQNKPVEVEQAADPQAQSFAFKEDPSVDAQNIS